MPSAMRDVAPGRPPGFREGERDYEVMRFYVVSADRVIIAGVAAGVAGSHESADLTARVLGGFIYVARDLEGTAWGRQALSRWKAGDDSPRRASLTVVEHDPDREPR
jgi:hypothetical protein